MKTNNDEKERFFDAAVQIASGIMANEELFRTLTTECQGDSDKAIARVSVFALAQVQSIQDVVNMKKDSVHDESRRVQNKN